MQFWMKEFERHSKDIFVQEKKELYKCACISLRIHQSLTLFTSKITRLWSEHLKLEFVMDTYKLKEFSAILNERISKKGIFVQVKKELYKCVFLSEFINVWPV